MASNGARILRDGVDDVDWHRTVTATIAETSAPLALVHAHLESLAGDWVSRLRIADETFCYLVVDTGRQPADLLADLDGWCRRRGWHASQQGRKIYAVPDAVTKSAAIAEVRRRLADAGVLDDDAPLLAAGDGWLDRDLLESATAAVRPAHGELAERGWHAPHVHVTAARGIGASEEILAWFAAPGSSRPGPGNRLHPTYWNHPTKEIESHHD
ncbi:hypothetical protein [Gordonia sp. (in: high G+C Gram-positive bacteria)]|uniref:hypothetical protein n=1 Tax=Gordonia sp. (in: high G+C Gram-positive bacteria) TaxID=84139 RepID=UPI0039E71793